MIGFTREATFFRIVRASLAFDMSLRCSKDITQTSVLLFTLDQDIIAVGLQCTEITADENR